MTEDILFDNIYIGHSVEDAKALAAETFNIKKPLEVAQQKAKAELDIDEMDTKVSFKEDPVEFVRQKVFTFIDLAKLDPVVAFKSHPETGAALVGALVTLFGMLGVLFGIIGSSQRPITKVCPSILPASITPDIFCGSHRKRRTPQLQMTRKSPRRPHQLRQQARPRKRTVPSRSGSEMLRSKAGCERRCGSCRR
jgi:hypothetical protein